MSRATSRPNSRPASRPHSKSRPPEAPASDSIEVEDVEAGVGAGHERPSAAGFAVEEVNEQQEFAVEAEGDARSQFDTYDAAPDGEVAYDYSDYQGELVTQVLYPLSCLLLSSRALHAVLNCTPHNAPEVGRSGPDQSCFE